MALFSFRRDASAPAGASSEVEAFLKGYSIEVMPVSYTHLDVYKRQVWRNIRCI